MKAKFERKASAFLHLEEEQGQHAKTRNEVEQYMKDPDKATPRLAREEQ